MTLQMLVVVLLIGLVIGCTLAVFWGIGYRAGQERALRRFDRQARGNNG